MRWIPNPYGFEISTDSGSERIRETPHIRFLNWRWNFVKCRASLSADPLVHAYFGDAETRALLSCKASLQSVDPSKTNISYD